MNYKAVSLLLLLNVFLSLVLGQTWELVGEQESGFYRISFIFFPLIEFLEVFLMHTELLELLGLEDKNDFKDR